jgi:hypothetical protein
VGVWGRSPPLPIGLVAGCRSRLSESRRPLVDCSRVKDKLNLRIGRYLGGCVEWEILMTAEVEAFLDGLYEADRSSHRLVNQAILVLERNGLRRAARCWTP